MNVEKDWLFRTIVLMMVAAMITALFFDGISHRGSAATAQRATLVTSTLAGGTGAYAPQTRTFVVTTVPLLVHEQAATFDYLKQDFSPKGMLATKEVSFTVYAGDTVRVTVVNPSGDDHTFTLPEVGFNLYVKAQSTASGTFIARAVGPFTFVCTIAEHSPYMSGQLIVLPDSVAPQA